VQALRSEGDASRQSLNSVGGKMTDKLTAVTSNIQQQKTETSSWLEKVHEELVKANQKNFAPLISLTASIDGQELASAVASTMTNSPGAMQKVSNGVTQSVLQSANRRTLGRALNNGGV
jgi:hypothetical protein